jgi:hypothetical protein
VQSEPSHDEDQFIASAVLLARDNLLPYRDYPFFHLPNLVLVYAVLIKIFGYPFLMARLFTAFCSSLTAVLILFTIINFYKNVKFSLWISILWVFLMEASPLFDSATSVSWNHALGGLLATAGFVSYLAILFQKQNSLYFIFWSGFLISSAVGTRASLVTLVLPMVLGLFFISSQSTFKEFVKLNLPFWAGFIVALLPSIYLFSQAPNNFFFGNLEYAKLNTMYRIDTEFYGAFSLSDKVRFMFKHVLGEPGNFMLIIGASFFSLTSIVMPARPSTLFLKMQILLMMMVAFSLIGSLLPTPSWYQYFYAPIPFMVLCGAMGMAQFISDHPESQKWNILLLVTFALYGGLYASHDIKQTVSIMQVKSWQPVQVHIIGMKLKQSLGAGKVLTLSPVYPLEGGLYIYPALATGPFAWRTSNLISDEQRNRYNILSEVNLNAKMVNDPPVAILVGLERNIEDPLISYAKTNGYEFNYFLDSIHLWVK